MRHVRRNVALVLGVGLVIVACGSRPESRARTNAESQVDGVRRAEAAAVEAWNRGDLAAHVAIYADTGTGGPPLALGGRERVRASLAPLFNAARPTLRVDSMRVSPLGSEYVLASGKWTLTSARPTRSGWFTHIWARLPVGWRIVYEHST